VGGQRVPAADVLHRDDNQLRFRVPGLVASPDRNLPVGLRLKQGGQEVFRGAALTYVADPRIDQSGLYDRLAGTLNAQAKRFTSLTVATG